MKKSKFFKILCSLVLCLTFCFAFMGCDAAENAKEAIDVATSIIPVEYSEDLARNVLKAAITTSCAQKNIVVVDDYIDYNDGLKQRVEQLKRMKIENEDGFINEYEYVNQTLPSRYIAEMWRIENAEGDKTYTKRDAGETKTYKDSSYSLMAHCFNDIYLLDESMVSIMFGHETNIASFSGRYFNGYEIINIQLKVHISATSTIIYDYEFKIKDGLVVYMTSVSSGLIIGEGVATMAQSFTYRTITYGNAVIPEIDTSEFTAA